MYVDCRYMNVRTTATGAKTAKVWSYTKSIERSSCFYVSLYQTKIPKLIIYFSRSKFGHNR